MAMNVNETKGLIEKLAVNLSFIVDYHSRLDDSKKILIVEGRTDEAFISNYLNDDVICVVANKAFATRNSFSPNDNLRMNYKSAITNSIYGIDNLSAIMTYPKSINEYTFFGMVDLDWDNPNDKELSGKRIFVTDTHDLETMMMCSDNDIFGRLKNCNIDITEVQKALHLSLQIANVRKIILDNYQKEIPVDCFLAGSKCEISFNEFVVDNKINLLKLISYLFDSSNQHLPQNKIKSTADKLLKDKQLKKQFDSNYCWKTDWESFDVVQEKDAWKLINGHDVLAVIRYYNCEAQKQYGISGSGLNRNFEMALIENYEKNKFCFTNMYEKMCNESVVKEL